MLMVKALHLHGLVMGAAGCLVVACTPTDEKTASKSGGERPKPAPDSALVDHPNVIPLSWGDVAPSARTPCPRRGAIAPQSTPTVVNRIYTNPSEAVLTLDGVRIANPAEIELPSGERHNIETSLPGYVSRRHGLASNFDTCIYVELKTIEEQEDLEKTREAARKREEERRENLEKRRVVLEKQLLACLAKFRPSVLGGARLVTRWEQVSGCYAKGGTQDLALQGNVQTAPFAYYGPKKHPISANYFCSDVCPAYGGVLPAMALDAGACFAAGGVPSYDPAWGGYRGCTPREFASEYQIKKAERRRKH